MEQIGTRMKENYEQAFKSYLPKRMPVIIRLDGKSFHTLTRTLNKPYDENFIYMMQQTALYLCKNVQNCIAAYVQSDEISLLLHNYKKLDTQSWFGNEVQKMVSISAALASSYFTELYYEAYGNFNTICFDSRAFVLPEAEVNNYFYWRYQDWVRNSIQMLAQSLYSHKELHKKNSADLHEMCFQKGYNWAELKPHLKNGTCYYLKNEYALGGNAITSKEWVTLTDFDFHKNPEIIEDLLKADYSKE